MRGKFITLEGIDGAGKSTHLDWLADFFRKRGVKLRVTREPGGTELGEKLRGLLLDKNQAMHLETEAMLMFAARSEHIDKVIAPALAQGEWIICDRFTDATFAYQGSGRGADWARLKVLEQWVQGDLQPDLTLFFDVPLEVARQRLLAQGTALDRFEQENLEFFIRVRAGYCARVAGQPARFRQIDGTKSRDEIRKLLEEIVSTLCL